MVDVYPTLIKLAGGSLEQPADRRHGHGSDADQGRASPRTTTIYSGGTQQAAVLKDGWKLGGAPPCRAAWNCSNWRQDPYEQNNLAAANPAKVAELQQLVEADKTAALSKFIANASAQ